MGDLDTLEEKGLFMPGMIKTHKEILLDYLEKESDRAATCPSYDAKLWCDEGGLSVHKLVLAASSHLLASSMMDESEDIENIFIEGVSMSALEDVVKFLYQGGDPSEDCLPILKQMGITAGGLNKTWKGKWRSSEVKPDVNILERETFVKNEPSDDLDADAMCDEDDSVGQLNVETELLEGTEKSTLLGIQMYFSMNEESKSGMIQCSLCFTLVKNNEVAMLQHFSNHPDELDKINSATQDIFPEKKRKKSKIWDYFDHLDGTTAICTNCGKTLNTYEGATTHLIYHLRTRHADEYAEFNASREKTCIDEKTLQKEEKHKRKERRGVKRRSNIWIYFRKKDELLIECIMCSKQIVMSKNSKGSTTLLIQHLRVKHNHEYKVFQALKGRSIPNKKELTGALEMKLKKLPPGITVKTIKESDEEENGEQDVKVAPTQLLKVKKKEKVSNSVSKAPSTMVWLYFSSAGGAGKSTSARCNTCQDVVECGEDADNTDILLDHIKNSHQDIYEIVFNSPDTKGEDLDMVMCEFCSETFSKSKMMLHIYSIHYDQWAGNTKERMGRVKEAMEKKMEMGPYFRYLLTNFCEVDPGSKSPGKEVPEEGGMDCKICFVVVKKDVSTLESHLKYFHPEVDLTDQMSLSYWLMATPLEGEVSCNICGEKFNKETHFMEHVKEKHRAEHPDIMDWQECMKNPTQDSFKLAVLLDKHDKTGGYWENGHHPSIGEYGRLDDPVFRTCTECKKVFSSSSSMRYHQRVVHSGDKPFKCNICEKVFNRKDSLETHLASHSDLKPFMCSVCGKQFGRRHVRDTHERRHRGERRYPCHLCVKKFASSQQLKNHIRVHTGEKPFSCEHCGRMFAVKHQLVTHLRVHTGEKPYGCDKCNQKFKHLSTRRNHKCFGADRKPDPDAASTGASNTADNNLATTPPQNPLAIREQLFMMPLNKAYPMGL